MPNKNQNPFADFFTGFADNNPFASAFDWDQAVSAGRLNAKAFSDAAKAAAEGAQAISRRYNETAQKFAEDCAKFAKDTSYPSNSKEAEASIAKQAEFAQKSLDSAIKNAKELSEIAAKSNNEAGEIISERISSALSEIAANANTKKKPASAA